MDLQESFLITFHWGGGTLTGALTIASSSWGNQLILHRTGTDGTWGPSIWFYNNNSFLGTLGMDTNGVLYRGDNGNTKYKIWHEGNDGSGSGLDADTLDGSHASSFALSSHIHNIGGINHFSNSITTGMTTRELTVNGYTIGNQTLHRIQNMNFNGYSGDWTVTLWIKASEQTTVNFDLCDVNANSTYGEASSQTITTDYTYHRFVFLNVNQYNVPGSYNGFLDMECGSSITLYIKDLKVEKGICSSDWSLSPYDVANGIGPEGMTTKVDVLKNARTLTIGSTGKTFDGSANVSWSLSEIGAAASSHTHAYLPLAGGWMDAESQVLFKGKNGSTNAYACIGYKSGVSGTMHANSAANTSGAFYIWTNGYDTNNDNGGLAIDNEGVTVFGAGDPSTTYTAIFRVVNEDAPADGAQFYVTKATGAVTKYDHTARSFIANNYVRASGNDIYAGSASGSQCHMQYDSSNECMKFLFD